jgi:putative transcription factor
MTMKKSRTHTRPKGEYGASFDCDICGKQNATNMALIEGARMAVCANCSKFGKILNSMSISEKPAAGAEQSPDQEIEDIVENYGRIIHAAREKISLPLKVLAEKIQERESYLEKIEAGKLLPSINVARKLEKELAIRLVEKSRIEHVRSSKSDFKGPTLGDMIEVKPKGRK